MAPNRSTASLSRTRYAVIVAGGKGLRMGSDIPKQFLLLDKQPVLSYAIRAFLDTFADIRLIVVHASGDEPFVRAVTDQFPGIPFRLATGGETRFHSVQNGLRWVEEPSVVFIHDGVRPLVSSGLIRRCEHAAREHGSAVPALELKESIRRISGADNFAEDRTRFRAVQTPQTFLSELVLEAFRQPYDPGFTDEASVAEKAGISIHLVPGEDRNIKITRPEDLVLAETLLTERKMPGR